MSPSVAAGAAAPPAGATSPRDVSVEEGSSAPVLGLSDIREASVGVPGPPPASAAALDADADVLTCLGLLWLAALPPDPAVANERRWR